VPDGLKVDTSNVPASGSPSGDTAATTVLERGGSVSHLLSHANYLAPQLRQKLKALQPPSANQAQVLRMATYEGDAVVGGYTIVIRGAEGT
jgi:ABC-type hemin transport system substrate-binding protein